MNIMNQYHRLSRSASRYLAVLLLLGTAASAKAQEGDEKIDSTVTKKSKKEVVKQKQRNWQDFYTKRAPFYFDKALMGNELGVYSSSNGFSGNAGNLLIRGVTTANINSAPYVIVDGLPVRQTRIASEFASGIFQSNLGFINPLDIKEIKVVKDGFNSSKYGGKSGNGIIEVGIDRGAETSSYIELMARYGFIDADASYDVMSSADYRPYLYNTMMSKGATAAELQNNPMFDTKNPKYAHETDWFDLVKKKGAFQDIQLKMKGGDAQTTYLFGIGYTGEEGTLLGDKDQRVNLRFSLDFAASKKLNITTLFSYTYGNMRFLGQGVGWLHNPIYQSLTKAPFMSPNYFSKEGIEVNRPDGVDIMGRTNPVVFDENLNNRAISNRVDAIINAKWKMTKHWSLNGDVMVAYNALTEKLHQKSYGIAMDRYIERQNSKRTQSDYLLRINAWLDYLKKLGATSQFNFQLGASFDNNEERMIYSRKVNAGSDEIVSVGGGKFADSVLNNRYTHNLMNVYSSAHISLFNRVNVAGRINMERSSNFGKDGHWNTYAGAEAGLMVIGNEKGRFDLIAQWGISGNHDIRGGYYDELYLPTGYYTYGGVYLGNIENDELKPEVTNHYDLGAKALLFGNRVEIGANYYIKNTKDLLTRSALPIEVGMDPQYENSGEIENSGIEAYVSGMVIQSKKISWSLFANVSTLKNKVVSLENGEVIRKMDGYTGVLKEEEEIGSFYGYRVKGIYQNEEQITLLRQDGRNYEPGDYIIEDVNKDGRINDDDRVVIGSPLPEFFGGFGSDLRVGNFSVNAQFTYSYGNEVYNLFDKKMKSMSDYSNQSVAVAGRWISETIPGEGILPRAAYGDPSDNFATSDRWVEDASYIKLKSVNLSYQVPMRNRAGFIKGVRLFATGNNLVTWTDYSGFDPEVFSSNDPLLRGVDTGAMPNPRSYIFGLNVSF